MRYHAAPADPHAFVHEGFGVVAVASALKSVKVHEHGRCRIKRLGLRPVPGNNVVVGRSDDFPSISHLRTRGDARRNDGLQVASRAPGRSTVIGLGNRHGEIEAKILNERSERIF